MVDFGNAQRGQLEPLRSCLWTEWIYKPTCDCKLPDKEAHLQKINANQITSKPQLSWWLARAVLKNRQQIWAAMKHPQLMTRWLKGYRMSQPTGAAVEWEAHVSALASPPGFSLAAPVSILLPRSGCCLVTPYFAFWHPETSQVIDHRP